MMDILKQIRNDFFGEDYKKYILIGDCSCDMSNLVDIAGTDFRTALNKKQLFRHADKELQLYIHSLNIGLFEI